MKKLFTFLLILISTSIYCQKDTVSVITRLDEFIVNKQSKILYRGLPNNLEISVPNAISFKVSSSTDSLKKISKNKYFYFCGNGTEVKITIESIFKNKKKLIEYHVFSIKNVSKYLPTINNRFNDKDVLLVTKEFLKNAKIGFKNIDSNLDFMFLVNRFTVKIPGLKENIVQGNTIDDYIYKKIEKLSSGEIIVISDIVPKSRFGGGGMCYNSPPLVLQIR